MASPPVVDLAEDAPRPEPALAEAQQWIEQVTGRTFGDKDFRLGLENGVLLCELLNSIKPGLVKKINRLPTPIAGLDNIALFLRGCKELGLKESQLFDPGDLQDTSNRAAVKNHECTRKLKNVLVTIYWLGKAANSSTYFSGATLNLKEFEGLLTQMKKDTEDVESPKRSIRDSGYVDCWDSERSDSLSPPRHGRDDSFDSLDSFGSRSQQTPSPDVVLRGSSDGRGSDSESDLPHRKLPDVKKDDMSARRTSYGEPKSVVPFNQYLPNKNNQTAYIPAPLRKKKAEREEFRKSWSTATSPLGERPFSKTHPETIEEEQSEVLAQSEEDLGCTISTAVRPVEPFQADISQQDPLRQSPTHSANKTAGPRNNEKDPEELKKLRRLEEAGIKIMPAAQRYGSSQKHISEKSELTPDIILRKENPFMLCYQQKDSGSEDERDEKIPDIEKDDFAIRKARLNQPKLTLPFNHYFLGSCTKKERGKVEEGKKQSEKEDNSSGKKVHMISTRPATLCEAKPALPSRDDGSKEKNQAKLPDIQRDGLARRKTQANPSQLDLSVFVKAPITQADKAIWDRLKVSGNTSDEELTDTPGSLLSSEMTVETSHNSFASPKVQTCKKTTCPKQRFVHFGPVTEIDHQQWEQPSVTRAVPKNEIEETTNRKNIEALEVSSGTSSSVSVSPEKSIAHADEGHKPHAISSEILLSEMDMHNSSVPDVCDNPEKQIPSSSLSEWNESSEEELDETFPDIERDDMLARRFGTFQKSTSPVRTSCSPISVVSSHHPLKQEQNVILCRQWKTPQKVERFGSRTPVSDDAESVSMFDMRCVDEATVMQPHSKARHEKLQTIHNQLKEDEDRWQDDLARWKSRRRSASQDLLKKEAERKKMERLLTGAEGPSERRKSIKTYREIVEEKERREKELHEAYKNARSREEADHILQQYIERFTISEAVLERLEMPKILERSHSAEPNSSSPPKDPNPLRYLRQQSLPAPKYTAKVEATIVPSGSEASISTGRTSPSKPFPSKAVPMLTPKPYSQPKNTQQVFRTFKVDGKVSMNGEAVNGMEEERERECTALIFAPSPSRSPKSDYVVEVDGISTEGKQDATNPELVLKRLIEHNKHREQADSLTEDQPTNQINEFDSERPPPASNHKEFSAAVSCASPIVTSVKYSSLSNHSKEMTSVGGLKKLETSPQKEAPLLQKVETSGAPEQDGGLVFPLLKKIPEMNQVVLQNSALQADSDNRDKLNRLGCWSWNPEEERKRQERWQHEQERVLQERYQKEQDKLKEEWEKAQKEVEEEERKYYEEERKIIEDTVVPFTVTSNSAEHLSTSSSVTDGNGTLNMVDMSNSEEEHKPKDRTPKKLFCEQDGTYFSKSKEHEPLKENLSTVNEVCVDTNQRRSEQENQRSMSECTPPTKMTLPLYQDTPRNQTKQSPRVSDVKQKNSLLEHNLGPPVNSAKEIRRAGCRESSRTGPTSPGSPTMQSQSPNRSISGKKLCSSCGQPLGKGAAMIIESLGLYFHIQCFRCGICKGQLGDAASGTDVRIRNGLLNCNDCYIRSRSAGQPTTL